MNTDYKNRLYVFHIQVIDTWDADQSPVWLADCHLFISEIFLSTHSMKSQLKTKRGKKGVQKNSKQKTNIVHTKYFIAPSQDDKALDFQSRHNRDSFDTEDKCVNIL